VIGRSVVALSWSVAFAAAACAEVAVVDDEGNRVALAQPARRIVSLAPHVTELLFAAGAGERIVGAVAYSDHPPAAQSIRRIGSYHALDLEAIMALRADLVVGWSSGNNPGDLRRLKQAGLAVFASQPWALPDIPRVMERLAVLAGTEDIGARATAAFRSRLATLAARYAGRPEVSVFYVIWRRPLMTVNDTHLISDVVRTCSGRNVFGDLKVLVPTIDEEAVVRRDPEVIIASGVGENRPESLDEWKRWPRMTAVRRGNLYAIPPELMQRATPRVLDGAERLCAALEDARRKR
jgi:iron complex transport system substrate-binding protein